MIAKESNFKQPGERFRSFDAARQERFINRFTDLLSDPRQVHKARDASEVR